MEIKTIGLGLHFLLELAALTAVAVWGFQTNPAWWQKILLGIGLPLLVAAVWGIFRVPNDPGAATVAISGPLRLMIELAILNGAAALLYSAGHPTLAVAFALAILIDYAIQAERVAWLIRGS